MHLRIFQIFEYVLRVCLFEWPQYQSLSFHHRPLFLRIRSSSDSIHSLNVSYFLRRINPPARKLLFFNLSAWSSVKNRVKKQRGGLLPAALFVLQKKAVSLRKQPSLKITILIIYRDC